MNESEHERQLENDEAELSRQAWAAYDKRFAAICILQTIVRRLEAAL